MPTIRSDDDHIFTGIIRFFKLPVQFKGLLKIGSVTPIITDAETWIAQNTGPITITNLLGGYDGQQVRILGDGQTTMANNANIVTNTGANKLLASNKFYRFTLHNKVWYEDA